MCPFRDNTADAVALMSRSSNDEAMPDWVAGDGPSKASLVWWCVRLSVCSACLIRQRAVDARLFLVHRHCASLGTNEPWFACSCYSAGGASCSNLTQCFVTVTCDSFGRTVSPIHSSSLRGTFHIPKSNFDVVSRQEKKKKTCLLSRLHSPEQHQTEPSLCLPYGLLSRHTRDRHTV